LNDEASVRRLHQGQQSVWAASKGRTHDCKRPMLHAKLSLARRGPSTHEACEFILTLGAAAAWPHAAWAQQGDRTRSTRVRVSFNKPGGNATMIFKMLAFVAAAIPIFLFVRSMLLRRPTRINEGYKEFKKQSDLAVSIFLFLIGCVVIFAVGKLVWAWL
jgi:hypothetical protein